MPDPSSVSTDAIDALIQRCLGGDQAAWEDIVRQHRRKVFNIAYKFTGRHDEVTPPDADTWLAALSADGEKLAIVVKNAGGNTTELQEITLGSMRQSRGCWRNSRRKRPSARGQATSC